MSMNIEVGGFTFISDFDSGNLGRVELVAKKTHENTTEADKPSPDDDVPDFEFNLWTAPDCAGTEYENGNRTWFYFGIRGGTPCANMQLNIVDLNKQTKMYSQGMAPVCRIVPGKHHWERIKEKPQFRVVDNVFILTFKYRTPENPRATVYFAFTYPYPYFELQNMLHTIDNRFKVNQDESRKRSVDLDDIYYHRECVCYSLEGRRIDLITISSHHFITEDQEPRLKFLFPEADHPRPFRFTQKKIVFVSARVHPGETPSSFVMNGLLKFLLQRDDPVAVLLRKNYVFKLVPMLNPDGVCNGHYRTDTRGVNLNRVYSSPSFVLHPAIYAARSLILYYHHGQEIEEVVTGPVFDPASRKFKSRSTPLVTESDSAEFSDVLSPSSDLLSLSNVKCLDSINENDLESSSSLENQLCIDSVNQKQIISSIENHMSCLSSIQEDSQNASNIENQVSCLTLDEKSAIHSKDYSNTSNVLSGISNQVDVLSVICEAVIRKVFDMNEVDKKASTSVGENFQNELLVGTTQEQNAGQNKASEYSQTEAEEALIAQRSETSLSVGSVESSVCSGSYGKSNFINEDVFKEQLKCGEQGKKNIYTPPENSGLFLYLDLHGHASKKGIFMYGNHFDNIGDSVECMLLPKIMSLNSPNFHFSACNFTERNMYLRDRKDGSSREGCGRVSVLKATGLVRSYTLECNYNTGRLVNIVPPCVRDLHKPNQTLLVPPKYTPHVFEEIGQALCASVLDLTGTHPWSRVPNSEFRTLNGIRDWLKANCVPEQMYIHKSLQHNNRHSNSRRQLMPLFDYCKVTYPENEETDNKENIYKGVEKLIGWEEMNVCNDLKLEGTNEDKDLAKSTTARGKSEMSIGGQKAQLLRKRSVYKPPKKKFVVCLSGASVRMSRPARASGSGCKPSRHETKRRLAPLASKAAKAAGCSNNCNLDSTTKSEDEGSSSGIDFDRKENVTSFQIISPPQTPKHMKLNKSNNPKENVSPSSSQKISNSSKKLKAVTGVGVLKQVLAVRTKCTSVNALSGSSKVRSTTGLKINKTSFGGNNHQKNRRVPFNHCVKCVTSDTQISSDHTNSEGFKSTGTQAVIDQSGDTNTATTVTERNISSEKAKYVKDESKEIIKHGPKRLKVSSSKTDQQANIAQKIGPNKLSLKEICYLNLRKQKKKFSKLAMLNESVAENTVASSSSEKSPWEAEHNPKVVPLRATRQNSKSKLVHKTLNPNSISGAKPGKINNPGPSSNIKVKASCKSEKFLKNKVPHLSPIKTHKISPSLGRKVCSDTGKKWGKASLKTLATSFGKLRAFTEDSFVIIEKKRKKSKVKH
ncbi:uncharacterized protein GBIM_03561 [Gryllus bimaculatus]|nr:uncharacterized protein GBIM_03561 [Gryllus bimaculatus]